MKIVALPGVGFQDIKDGNIYLVNELKKHFPNDEIEYYPWRHEDIKPDLSPFNDCFLMKPIRNWVIEIILDFQEVVTSAISIDIPDADLYIGHSAGGVISIVRNKPTILMGCPAALIKNLEYLNLDSVFTNITEKRPILNIVNKNDVIGLPFKNAENYYYSAGWNPISAHRSYWTNEKVLKKCVEFVKKVKILQGGQ
jgi:hypothetical protein